MRPGRGIALAVALFEIHMKYGDVVLSTDVLGYLGTLEPATESAAH